MKINGVTIDPTFAEAFPMKATRVIITADSPRWAKLAASTMTGFATSVIACGCEASIELILAPEETPDGRHGVAILLFAMGGKGLAKQVETRAGQCVLTSSTSSLFSGIDGGKRIPLGKNLRFFGDGNQISKLIGGKRYWRIPVMHGEFVVEESTGMVEAIGGGNFLILARTKLQAIAAADAAVTAIKRLSNVIMPFPGGVVGSGSKVGSKYPSVPVSVNDAFCPTLKGVARHSELSAGIECVLEIVINGFTQKDIEEAMQTGIEATCALGQENGIKRVSAGNYGGKLGPYHFKLQEIMA